MNSWKINVLQNFWFGGSRTWLVNHESQTLNSISNSIVWFWNIIFYFLPLDCGVNSSLFKSKKVNKAFALPGCFVILDIYLGLSIFPVGLHGYPKFLFAKYTAGFEMRPQLRWVWKDSLDFLEAYLACLPIQLNSDMWIVVRFQTLYNFIICRSIIIDVAWRFSCHINQETGVWKAINSYRSCQK